MEASRVADLGDNAGGGLWSDTVDRGEQLAHLELFESLFDVLLECSQSTTQKVDIFARIAHLQLVWFAVMCAD
jgi:hypothetical protein